MMITKDNLIHYACSAERYFIQQNIEQYVSEYRTIEDIEIMAISACWLNIGVRSEGVTNAMWAYNKFNGNPLGYVLNKSKNWTRFQQVYNKFTTNHTLHSWWQLMGRLYKIYSNGSTILQEVLSGIKEMETTDVRDATLEVLCDMFSGIGQMPTSIEYLPNKFVRFVMMMVRPRPFGTAIWSETKPEVFDATKTYIPLNSELLKTISDHELLESPNMSWKFGKSLYEYFSNVFPDDPARGYFSILGLTDYSPIK